ncbi:velvet factor-domain-containing protein [Syncephalis plumigaleata]|nr:velvet factor-domain-containing protein [Syncephalis plumigaleata]
MVYCKEEDHHNAEASRSPPVHNEQNMNSMPRHNAPYTGSDQGPYGHTRPDMVGPHVHGGDVPIPGRSDQLPRSHYPVAGPGPTHDRWLIGKSPPKQPQYAPADSYEHHPVLWTQAVEQHPPPMIYPSHPLQYHAQPPPPQPPSNPPLNTSLPPINTMISPQPQPHPIHRAATYPSAQGHDLAQYSRHALVRRDHPSPHGYVHNYQQGTSHTHGFHEGHGHMDIRRQQQPQYHHHHHHHHSQSSHATVNHYSEAHHGKYYSSAMQVSMHPHQHTQQVYQAPVVPRPISDTQVQTVDRYTREGQVYAHPYQHNEQAHPTHAPQETTTNNGRGRVVYSPDGSPGYESSYGKQKWYRMKPYDSKPLEYAITIEQQPIHGRVYVTKDGNDRRPLDPLPIVSVAALNSDDDSYMDNPYLSVQAYLINARDSKPARAGKGKAVFIGNSSHTGAPATYLDETKLYFAISDISVRLIGKFRLKLVLYEQIGNECRKLAVAQTNVFTVYPARDFPGMFKSSPLTCALAEQGFHIRIRKHDRIILSKRKRSLSVEDDYTPADSVDGDDTERQEEYSDSSDTERPIIPSKRAKNKRASTTKRQSTDEHSASQSTVIHVVGELCAESDQGEEEGEGEDGDSSPRRYSIPGTPIPCQISSSDVEDNLFRLGQYELETEPSYESPLPTNHDSTGESSTADA